MLRLILGRAGTGKSHYIRSLVARAIKEGPVQKKIIFLVPEQATLLCERELLEDLGNRAGAWCEVMSLRRLAHRVFCEEGGAAGRYADASAGRLVMHMAVKRTQDELSMLKMAAKKPEFLDDLLSAVDEFKSYNVTPDMLRGAALSCEGPLCEKLRDMSHIMDAYGEILNRSFKDPRDDLTRLREKLCDGDFLEGRTVLVDGFSGFTPQEMGVMEVIIERCRDVAVTLCIDGGDYGDEEGVFSVTLFTKRALEKAAQKAGVPLITDVLTNNRRFSPSLYHLEQNLYAKKAAIYPHPHDGVTLHWADSVFSEVEYAAAEIARMVRDEGMMYRDFVVIARDVDSYAGIVEAVFSRHSIPFFMDKKDDILTRPVTMVALCALEAVISGFSYDSLFRSVKTGLFGLSPDECDLLENYVIKWSVRGYKWERDFPWHPDGFARPFDEGATERLLELNGLRRRVAEPLLALKSGLKKAKTADEMALHLYDFLLSIGLPGRIEELCHKLEDEGRLELSAEYEQLFTIFTGVLDQMAAICKGEEITPDEFYSLLKLMLSGYDVGSIPTSLDEVLVGGAERIRPHEARCVIILGVNDGIMPMAPKSHGLFRDEDKESLERMGITLSPTTVRRSFMEQYHIYSAVTSVKDRAIFCCPRRGADGSALNPSYLIARLKKLFPNLKESDERTMGPLEKSQLEAKGFDYCALYFARPEGEKICRETAVLYNYFNSVDGFRPLLSHIERYRLGEHFKIKNTALIKKRFGHVLNATASRVETFYSCRFSYFMRYGLGAKEREVVRFSEPEIGTFIHSVLEEYLKEAKLSGMLSNAFSPEHSRLMIRRIVRGYIEKTFGQEAQHTNRFLYLFNRLCKTLDTIVKKLWVEFSKSDFFPMEFELDVGGAAEGVKAMELYDDYGNKIRVVGKVDRIDGYQKEGDLYVRVVDYKTGTRKFSFSDVLAGLGMQMLIYLFAVCDAGPEHYSVPTVPAGVLYLHVHQPVVAAPKTISDDQIEKKIEQSLKMNGLVLSDGDVVRAMERDIEGWGRFIPVYLKSGGSPGGGYAASAAQFARMRTHVEGLIRRMASDVLEGDVSRDPYIRPSGLSACTYCPYRTACLFDITDEKSRYRRLDSVRSDEFWNRLSSEEERLDG